MIIIIYIFIILDIIGIHIDNHIISLSSSSEQNQESMMMMMMMMIIDNYAFLNQSIQAAVCACVCELILVNVYMA
jgi:hypothetical protein